MVEPNFGSSFCMRADCKFMSSVYTDLRCHYFLVVSFSLLWKSFFLKCGGLMLTPFIASSAFNL